MNKKKLLPLLLSVALVGAVGIGATLAYFTDRETETNVITMGNVDIDLDEPNFDPDDDDNTVEDITPGEVIVKDPTITVQEGSADAYIRAQVVLDDDLTADQKADLLKNINIDLTKWILGAGGYYYYNEVAKAGDELVLFSQVTIPETWGNEVSNLTFTIDVAAEAIQADNFEPSVDKDGLVTWAYADGTAINAENYVAPSVSNGDAN